MKDYSTQVQAIIQGHVDGFTFVGLVRKLHECYEEPTLPEIQATLKQLVLSEKIKITGGYMNRPRFISTQYNQDSKLSYVLTDEELDMVIGQFGTWKEAWKAASIDWFATGGTRRCIYRAEPSWEFVYPGDEKGLDSVPAYIGAWEQPFMPKYEHLAAAPVSTANIINTEISAISEAINYALDKHMYTRLREEAEDEKIKLAFSVEVDIKDASVVAKMSGSIKLISKGTAEIRDPHQLELNLGKEGGKS